MLGRRRGEGPSKLPRAGAGDGRAVPLPTHLRSILAVPSNTTSGTMLLKCSDHFSQQEPEEWFHISGDQQSPVKLPQNTQTLQNRPSSLFGSFVRSGG